MPRAEEFDAFYTATRARLLHQTYALTSDLGATAAAVRDAYIHAWQYWHRLRLHDAEDWVRHESARLARLRHHSHLRSRLDESGADVSVLAALQALPATERRLLLLQSLGDLDLATAARDVAMTDEAALDATDNALHQVRSPSLADLGSRLDGLRAVTERVVMPRPSVIRKQGRRRRRRAALVAVAASITAVVGAGLLVTPPEVQLAAREDDDRRQAGEVAEVEPPPQPQRPPPPGAGTQQLLRAAELTGFDPRAGWTELPERRSTYPVCQAEEQADPRARDAYLRTFRADTDARQRLVQTVEVSRTEQAAERAHDRMLGWWGGCQVARLQLLDAYSIRRDGPDTDLLRLRSWRQPTRTITVAIARTGVVSTTLVHEVDRPQGPPIAAAAGTTALATTLLCSTSAGSCDVGSGPRPALLPPTGEGPGFLGVVDLPPVGSLTSPWAGTDPTGAGTNPAATLCDQASFRLPGFTLARSRTYVVPEPQLPDRFGLSETLGTMRGEFLAERFVDRVVSDVGDCEDRELSASVDSRRPISGGAGQGQVWQLTFEVADGSAVTYRLGIVRSGAALAQLTFSGTDTADVGDAAFADLVVRAGQRLRELNRPGGARATADGPNA